MNHYKIHVKYQVFNLMMKVLPGIEITIYKYMSPLNKAKITLFK